MTPLPTPSRLSVIVNNHPTGDRCRVLRGDPASHNSAGSLVVLAQVKKDVRDTASDLVACSPEHLA